MPNPNFEGINQSDPGAGFIPPDTNGDVGPNHYVQTVNSSIEIFDKQGTTLAGPMRINRLFVPLGGPCATGSVIDPIVNYDPLADRWVVMGFPFASPLCIAVSRTSDPVAGGWFLYAFDLGVSIPDYPKLGVWPDAYYLGLNAGPENVFALDRTNMLSGNPAAFVGFRVGGGGRSLSLPTWTDHDHRRARQLRLFGILTGIYGVVWIGWRSSSSLSISRIRHLPHSISSQRCRPIPSMQGSVAVVFLGTAPNNPMAFGWKRCHFS